MYNDKHNQNQQGIKKMTNSKVSKLIKEHVEIFVERMTDDLEVGRIFVDVVEPSTILSEMRGYLSENEKFLNEFGLDNLMNLLENNSQNCGFSVYGSLFDDVENTKIFSVFKADEYVMEMIGDTCFQVILKGIDYNEFELQNDNLTHEVIDLIIEIVYTDTFSNDVVKYFYDVYNVA